MVFSLSVPDADLEIGRGGPVIQTLRKAGGRAPRTPPRAKRPRSPEQSWVVTVKDLLIHRNFIIG